MRDNEFRYNDLLHIFLEIVTRISEYIASKTLSCDSIYILYMMRKIHPPYNYLFLRFFSAYNTTNGTPSHSRLYYKMLPSMVSHTISKITLLMYFYVSQER